MKTFCNELGRTVYSFISEKFIMEVISLFNKKKLKKTSIRIIPYFYPIIFIGASCHLILYDMMIGVK